MPAYQPTAWEKIVSSAVAASVIALVAYLAIRNEPFSSVQIAALVRILVSLAVAILGGTIPGFLGVNLSAKGLTIRAGGALALFVITYFYSPSLAPELSPKEIPPLVDPHPVSLRMLRKPQLIFAVQRQERSQNIEPSQPLKVLSALQGRDMKGHKEFDFSISNSSDQQRLLQKFHVRWLYEKGFEAAIDQGLVLRPQAQYLILLPIDTDKDDKVMEKDISLSPAILLPPRNGSGPSVTTFRLEVLYRLVGRLYYHPNSDWDIYYEITIEDDAGDGVELLSRDWRYDHNSDWAADYIKPPSCVSGLPDSLRSAVERDNWTIVQAPNLSYQDMHAWKLKHEGQCPGVTSGSFYPDGGSSFVIAIFNYDKDEHLIERLLVGRLRNGHPETQIVVRSEPVHDPMAVWDLPPGTYRDIDGNDIFVSRDSFVYGEPRGTSRQFYYTGSYFTSFDMSR